MHDTYIGVSAKDNKFQVFATIWEGSLYFIYVTNV